MPRRRLNALLLLLLVGIWSAVAVLLMRDTDRIPEPASPPASAADPPAPARPTHAPYRADFQDPFAPPDPLFVPSPDSSGALVPEPPSAAFPALRLLGVVGRTAIVRDERETVHLVGAGDTLRGVRILNVGADSVRIALGTRHVTLGL